MLFRSPTALPSPPAPARLRSHSQLRLSGQPPARCPVATLCSVTGLCARIEPRYAICSKRCSLSCFLDLPHLRRADVRDREAYCRTDPTPLSALFTRACRMKAQIPSRFILVLRHEPASCVPWASSQLAFTRFRSRSLYPGHTKLDGILSRTASSHPGIASPRLLSPLNAIQVP